MRGEIFPAGTEINEPPPLHIHCLLPDTICESPSGFISGLRTWYDGPIIELVITNGARISVTPNHMLLTPRGFAAADFLNEGDDIIYCPTNNGISINPDYNYRPTTISNVFESLSKSFGMMTSSMPSAAEYLHGDSCFCNSNIDIVSANSLLKNHISITMMFQEINKSGFYNTLMPDTVTLSRQSQLAFAIKSLAFASDNSMGRFRQSSPFFSSRPRHTQKHGFAPISWNDPTISKPLRYSIPTNTKYLRKLLHRFAGIIQTNKVIRVNIRSIRTPIYDLQTPSTTYIANGIISSNCRCVLVPVDEE